MNQNTQVRELSSWLRACQHLKSKSVWACDLAMGCGTGEGRGQGQEDRGFSPALSDLVLHYEWWERGGTCCPQEAGYNHLSIPVIYW